MFLNALHTEQTQPGLLGDASQNKRCASVALRLTCALRVDELGANSCPGYSHAVLLQAITPRQPKAKPDQGVTEAPEG